MLSDVLRYHVLHCGRSLAHLERDLRLSHGTLGRFLNEQRGLSLTTVDVLAQELGLELHHGKSTDRKSTEREL